MNFVKMQGIGNDYVYVDCFKENVKNPSAAASLRLNASRSTKTLAIDPLISKKQITQTGPSE